MFSQSIDSTRSFDGYELISRIWKPERVPRCQILMLHGIVSHSEWLAPIASQLVANDIEVICPDRRGTGLNTDKRGDAPSAKALIRDVEAIRNHYCETDTPTHIAGYCWGGSYAIRYLESKPESIRSLILIAPSIFPAADIALGPANIGESSVADQPPIVPIDRFTFGPYYENYIIPDPLRTRAVSSRFNSILVEFNQMLGPRWSKLSLPCLMILADSDRLSDNRKHEMAFARLLNSHKQKIVISGGHGLQFDAPLETAEAIIKWLEMFDTHD